MDTFISVLVIDTLQKKYLTLNIFNDPSVCINSIRFKKNNNSTKKI